MKRIKIVYLINSFIIGGAERGMTRFLKILDKKNFDITVVGLMEGDNKILNELNELDINIINLKAQNKLDIRTIFKLYNLLTKIKPDILWCSLFHSTIVGRLTGKLAGVPVIINWEHNQNLGGWDRKFLNKITSRYSKSILADSEIVKETLVNELKIDKKKIKTVYIGALDLDEYSSSRKRILNNKSIVGSIGSLTDQKGYEYLIKATRIVVEQHPEVHVHIAGEGIEKDKLSRLINHYNLKNNVELLGYRRDIPRLLNSWDIYVQPSLWEGLCITVIEAMACNLPVVASKVGGIPESVQDNVNGFLVSPKDHKILADKILYLIENKEVREEMGAKSREIVESKYNLKKTIEEVKEFLFSICKV
jgi:glycosyltransferase involved in cell wall biosynthesis